MRAEHFHCMCMDRREETLLFVPHRAAHYAMNLLLLLLLQMKG
jgi:hypothetical protein